MYTGIIKRMAAIAPEMSVNPMFSFFNIAIISRGKKVHTVACIDIIIAKATNILPMTFL